MLELAFNENKFAQQRLSSVGGYIAIKNNGIPVFRFKSKESLMKYCQIGKMKEAK